MTDNVSCPPVALLMLLAPGGSQSAALLMPLNGETPPVPLSKAASQDMLELAGRLLQSAGSWLLPGAEPGHAGDAAHLAAATTGGPGGLARPIKVGPFHVDGPHRLVRWRGPQGWRPIDLTDIERRLLCQLLAASGRVCSRSDIATGVWGSEAHNLRTVDQCVRRLRRSMLAAGVPDCIKTVRGIGYRIVPAVAGRRGNTAAE